MLDLHRIRRRNVFIEHRFDCFTFPHELFDAEYTELMLLSFPLSEISSFGEDEEDCVWTTHYEVHIDSCMRFGDGTPAAKQTAAQRHETRALMERYSREDVIPLFKSKVST